ncbi:MAG: hypothetical protein AB1401_04400 [Thermodesulfobacteriota bacterium]
MNGYIIINISKNAPPGRVGWFTVITLDAYHSCEPRIKYGAGGY